MYSPRRRSPPDSPSPFRNRRRIHTCSLISCFDARNLLDRRQLIYGLRIVCHRAVGIDRDRHRVPCREIRKQPDRKQTPPAQPSGCRGRAVLTPYAMLISARIASAEPICAHVARHETRKNVQRRAALARRSHHFAHMTRLHRREYLNQFGNHRAGQRSASDHGR